MLVDLVHASTSDGVRLHGILELPSQADGSASRPSPIDVWLCIHGTGSNFYAGTTLAGIAPKLLAGGAAVLRVNTRGHDLICTGPSSVGRPYLGASFERVDESPRDLTAWIDFLRQRGFGCIGLLGHSLGAVKSVYTLAGDNPPPVAALVAVSPPRLSHSWYSQSTSGEEFLATYAASQELVAAGRGDEVRRVRVPLGYYVSAAAYVDRYSPAENYNVLRLFQRVGCPALATFGTVELNELGFRGMPEALEPLRTDANALQVAVIAGADHIYTGCHDSLAARILKWTGQLPK